MKVLWITNIVFPEANGILTGKNEFKSSGGWMLAMAEALKKDENVQLVVASVSNKVDRLTKLSGEGVVFYLLPMRRWCNYNQEYEIYWKEIKKTETPDVIHIHGTEFPYGLSYIKACGNKCVVISIQGLVSVIARYYKAGLTNWDIFRNLTIRDVFNRSIWSERKRFVKKGQLEVETLQLCKSIIGRTLFDEIHVKIINPEVNYYVCNETLRNEFYSGQWNYDSCKKFSIFLSQGWYPLKGIHQVLKALPHILKKYPETKIRIAGPDLTKADTIIQRLRMSGYAKYLRRMIKKLQIEEFVSFIGSLDADGVKKELLSCNVFVCPSSIENSSNSLAEAQLLGVPCVASYVGGLPSMMKGDEKNLYRFEEYEMMAALIMDNFECKTDREPMRKVIRKRHDPDLNMRYLLEIYKRVSDEE